MTVVAARPPGQGQRASANNIRPWGKPRAPELLEERIGLAGPAERGRRAALLEMKEGVLHGDERSRFGRADNPRVPSRWKHPTFGKVANIRISARAIASAHRA